jgi:hypothetical protein
VQPTLTRSVVRDFLQSYRLDRAVFQLVDVSNTLGSKDRRYVVSLLVVGEVALDLQENAARSLAFFLKEKGYPNGEVVTIERLIPD